MESEKSCMNCVCKGVCPFHIDGRALIDQTINQGNSYPEDSSRYEGIHRALAASCSFYASRTALGEGSKDG